MNSARLEAFSIGQAGSKSGNCVQFFSLALVWFFLPLGNFLFHLGFDLFLSLGKKNGFASQKKNGFAWQKNDFA